MNEVYQYEIELVPFEVYEARRELSAGWARDASNEQREQAPSPGTTRKRDCE